MMKPSGFSLYKANYIASTQAIKLHRPIGKALAQKALDMYQIGEHCCGCEPAFSFQVQPKFFGQPLRRRSFDWRILCDDAFIQQKAEQPSQNRGVPRSVVAMTGSVFQVALKMA